MRLPAVVLADDAVERLDQHAGACPLVVMDVNTREACGERAMRALGPGSRELVFDQRHGLLAGMDEVAAVRAAALHSGAAGRLVAVGSGVITDIVRYAAHELDREFVSVPTAASMDGYASGVAAMQIDGVKVTFPSRAPVAILADPRVAAAAPSELTRAGLGDLLAKASAGVDWLASHLLYAERYDDGVAELVARPLRLACSSASAVLAGDPNAVAALLEGLIESGVAMAVFGNSRPASGCEHHASHFWDLLAAHGRRPHASHGLQVGYATTFAMRLQRFAFSSGGCGDVAAPARPVPPAQPLGDEARVWLGEPTREILEAVEEKQRFIAAAGKRWPADAGEWDRVRSCLAPGLAQFDAVALALELAEIPAGPGWLDIDEPTMRATFRFASRLRSRWTTIDFLESQGTLERAIDEMLA